MASDTARSTTLSDRLIPLVGVVRLHQLLRLNEQLLRRSGAAGGVVLSWWMVFPAAAAEEVVRSGEEADGDEQPDEWDKAVAESGPIAQYLKHHGDRRGDETKQVLEWQKQIEMSQDERLLAKYVSRRRESKRFDSQNEAQEDGFKAAWAEEEGKLDEAKQRWDDMKTKYESGSGFTLLGPARRAARQSRRPSAGQDKAWADAWRRATLQRRKGWRKKRSTLYGIRRIRARSLPH